jgi:NAD(P)-dependent dehydrogenase (short-subunit alcohol dehydrogenase family)
MSERREAPHPEGLDEVTLWGAEPFELPETFYAPRRSVSSYFDLAQRVALVTGAGGGLGREFALTLAEAGATVVCSDVDSARAKETAALITAQGTAAHALQLDVTDEAAVDDAGARIAGELGGLDVLVNNAGVGDRRSVPLHRVRTEDWRSVLDVDLDGVFHCSRAALRIMVERERGKIVNIASMFGLAGARIAPIPAYSAAKGAVVNLTRELGLQYAATGIQVNALCPGFVRTGLSDGVYDSPEFLDRLASVVPNGRVAEPADLRGALLMLASAASDHMTGQTLVIDGGYSAG